MASGQVILEFIGKAGSLISAAGSAGQSIANFGKQAQQAAAAADGVGNMLADRVNAAKQAYDQATDAAQRYMATSEQQGGSKMTQGKLDQQVVDLYGAWQRATTALNAFRAEQGKKTESSATNSVISGIENASKKVSEFGSQWRDKFNQMAADARASADRTSIALGSFGGLATRALEELRSNIGDKVGSAFDKLKSTANDAWTKVKDGATIAASAIGSDLPAKISAVAGVIKTTLAPATSAISANFTAVQGRLAGVFPAIVDGIKKIPGALKTITPVAIDALGKAAQGAAGKIGELAKNVATGAKDMLKNLFSGLGGGGGGGKGPFESFASKLKGVREQIMNLNDLFRLGAQAVTNWGRSLMFFVSLPLAGFFGTVTKNAIDFEDAMTRVGKTTGLVGEPFSRLQDNIRLLARNTKTSHAELAGMAEVIGQMGFTIQKGMDQKQIDAMSDAIFNLVQVFDMAAVAFGMTGEEIAKSLGRIGNAFGWNMQESSDEVIRLANVINRLENDTAAAADEIITATEEFAPFANALAFTSKEYKTSEANVVGFASTLVSLGLSANEAGTALRNMATNLPAHAKEVYNALKDMGMGYNDVNDVIEMMNTNAVQLFMDLLEAANKGGTSVEDMLTLMEMGDKRGGRALMALAGNVKLLESNLAKANNEWENHNSILNEYNRALGSTKSQLAMLQNNINDAGMTIGDALLPAINEIVQLIVPAIRAFSAWFKGLSKGAQMQIIMWAAVAVAAGPVLMFIGQMLQGFTLLFMGVGQLFRVIIWLIGGLDGLGAALAGVAGFLTSWPGIIAIAIVAILKILSKLGVDVAGMFIKMGNAARQWGENLAANLANGLLAGGVRLITRAIQYIANLIASFFESHSPPKAGPLSTIDEWGGKLMETYLKGFKNADFSILSEIGSMIEKILTAGLDDKALVGGLKKLAKARQYLAQLISKFNKSGVIDESLLDKATKGLGQFKDKVKELVRLQLQYNAIQEKIAALEAKRKNTIRGYDQEIAAIGASNMSMADKIKAIRAAQRTRDNSLRGIDKEKEALEEEAEKYKQQIEYQQQMIQALMDQKDIFDRIADILEKIAKSEKDSGGGDMGFGDAEQSAKDAQDAVGGLKASVDGVIDRFEKGGEAWDTFLKGFNGEDPGKGLSDFGYNQEAYQEYMKFYDLGLKIGQIKDTLVGFWKGISDAYDSFVKMFQGGGGQGGSIGDQIGGMFTDLTKNVDISGITNFFKILGDAFMIGWNSMGGDKLQEQWDALWQSFTQGLQGLTDFWNRLMTAFGQFSQTEGARTALVFLGDVIALLVAAIGGFFAKLMVWIPGLAQSLILILGWIGSALVGLVLGIVALLGSLISSLVEIGKLIIAGLQGGISEAWPKFLEAMGAIWSGFIQFIKNIFGIASPSTVFSDIATNIVAGLQSGIEAAWTAFQTFVGTKVGELVTAITGYVSQFNTAAVALVQGLIDGATTKIQEFVTLVTGIGQQALDGIKTLLGIASPSTVFNAMGVDLIQGLIDGVTSMISNIGQAIGGVGQTIIDTIGKFFGQNKDQADENQVTVDDILPTPGDVASDAGTIQTAVTGMITAIQNGYSTLLTYIQTNWGRTWADAAKTATSATDAIGKGISDGLGKRIDTFLKTLNTTWKTSWAAIQKSATDALSKVSTAVDSAKSSFEKMNTYVKGTLVPNYKDGFGAIKTKTDEAKSAVAELDQKLRDLPADVKITIEYNEQNPNAKALGGPVMAKSPYLVGEKGPELFVPNSNGAIIPHNELNALLSSGGEGAGMYIENIDVTLNNPSLRSGDDIQQIARLVAEQISQQLYRKAKFGGSPAL